MIDEGSANRKLAANARMRGDGYSAVLELREAGFDSEIVSR